MEIVKKVNFEFEDPELEEKYTQWLISTTAPEAAVKCSVVLAIFHLLIVGINLILLVQLGLGIYFFKIQKLELAGISAGGAICAAAGDMFTSGALLGVILTYVAMLHVVKWWTFAVWTPVVIPMHACIVPIMFTVIMSYFTRELFKYNQNVERKVTGDDKHANSLQDVLGKTLRTQINTLQAHIEFAKSEEQSEQALTQLSYVETQTKLLYFINSALNDAFLARAGKLTSKRCEITLRDEINSVFELLDFWFKYKNIRPAVEIAAGIPEKFKTDKQLLREVLIIAFLQTSDKFSIKVESIGRGEVVIEIDQPVDLLAISEVCKVLGGKGVAHDTNFTMFTLSGAIS